MLLQRKYENGKVSHVQVKHTGSNPRQNFSRRLVLAGLTEGWITKDGPLLTMKTADHQPDLEYTVLREPGFYCVSTGDKIPITDVAWDGLLSSGQSALTAREAQAWLISRGKNPDDYNICMAYECMLDADQHDQFKLGGQRG